MRSPATTTHVLASAGGPALPPTTATATAVTSATMAAVTRAPNQTTACPWRAAPTGSPHLLLAHRLTTTLRCVRRQCRQRRRRCTACLAPRTRPAARLPPQLQSPHRLASRILVPRRRHGRLCASHRPHRARTCTSRPGRPHPQLRPCLGARTCAPAGLRAKWRPSQKASTAGASTLCPRRARRLLVPRRRRTRNSGRRPCGDSCWLLTAAAPRLAGQRRRLPRHLRPQAVTSTTEGKVEAV